MGLGAVLTWVAFTAAMFGLLYTSSWALFVYAWETLSVLSFFLVNHRDARLALFWTGFGGSALMLLPLLSEYHPLPYTIEDISLLFTSYEPCLQNASAPHSSCLLLLAILTKSAQWPFRQWLYEVAVAPNYLSAFLHTATLVQAGLILLLRLQPQGKVLEIGLLIAGLITALGCLEKRQGKLLIVCATQVFIACTLLDYVCILRNGALSYKTATHTQSIAPLKPSINISKTQQHATSQAQKPQIQELKPTESSTILPTDKDQLISASEKKNQLSKCETALSETEENTPYKDKILLSLWKSISMHGLYKPILFFTVVAGAAGISGLIWGCGIACTTAAMLHASTDIVTFPCVVMYWKVLGQLFATQTHRFMDYNTAIITQLAAPATGLCGLVCGLLHRYRFLVQCGIALSVIPLNLDATTRLTLALFVSTINIEPYPPIIASLRTSLVWLGQYTHRTINAVIANENRALLIVAIIVLLNHLPAPLQSTHQVLWLLITLLTLGLFVKRTRNHEGFAALKSRIYGSYASLGILFVIFFLITLHLGYWWFMCGVLMTIMQSKLHAVRKIALYCLLGACATTCMGLYKSPDVMITQIAVDGLGLLYLMHSVRDSRNRRALDMILSVVFAYLLYLHCQPDLVQQLPLALSRDEVNTIVSHKRALDTLGEVCVFAIAGSSFQHYINCSKNKEQNDSTELLSNNSEEKSSNKRVTSLSRLWGLRPLQFCALLFAIGFLLRELHANLYITNSFVGGDFNLLTPLGIGGLCGSIIEKIVSLNQTITTCAPILALILSNPNGHSGGFAAGVIIGLLMTVNYIKHRSENSDYRDVSANNESTKHDDSGSDGCIRQKSIKYDLIQLGIILIALLGFGTQWYFHCAVFPWLFEVCIAIVVAGVVRNLLLYLMC